MSTGISLIVVVLIFYLALMYFSMKTRQWISHSEDYLIASRELSFFITTAGILAIGFASDITAMYSIFAIEYGYYAALALGTAYIGWILYGLLFTKMIRSIGTFTIGEWYELRFNVGTRIVMGLVLTFSVVLVAAAGVQGMAQMLFGFAGWPITASMASMLLIIGIIMVVGGMWSVTITDLVQTIFGYVVIPVILLYLLTTYGGFDWLQSRIPEAGWRLSFPGKFDFSLSGNSYLTWIVMWVFGLVFGSPYYWLRTVAARSDKAARNGFIWAGILGIVLMVYFMPRIALYAIAIKPEVFIQFGGTVHPAGALGVLASIIPPVLGILIILAMLAATISTYTTAGLGGVACMSRDIYQRLFRPQANPKEMLLPTRILTVVFIALTWVSTFLGNVPFLMGLFLSFVAISSTLVTLAAIWPKLKATAVFVAALIGLVATAFWAFTPSLVAVVHQVWIAIFATLLVAVIGSLITKSKVHGINNSERASEQIAASSEKDYNLHSQELAILIATATGANRFSDFIDTTQLDGQLVNEFVVGLERLGYICREGFIGAKYYTFNLTNMGRDRLYRAMPDQAQTLKLGLDYRGIKALQLAAKDGKWLTEDFASSLGIAPLEVASVLSGLYEQGCLKDTGIFRRRLEITAKGKEVLDAVNIQE